MTPALREALEGVGIHEVRPDGKPDPWFIIMSGMGRTLDPEDAKRLCAEVRNAVTVGTREGRRVEWGRGVALMVLCGGALWTLGLLVGIAL